MIFNRNKQESESVENNSEPELLEVSPEFSRLNESQFDNYDHERYGFYEAIAAGQNMRPALDEMIEQNNEATEKQIQLLEQTFDEALSEIGVTIESIEQKIKEQKERLISVRDQRGSTVDAAKELSIVIHEIKQDHQKLITELGVRHRDLVKERIDAVHQELNDLANMYNDVFDSKYKSETELKNALAEQRHFYKTLKSTLQHTYDLVQKKLDILYPSGVGPFSTNFLMAAGFGAAIAAACLFGIFAAEESLDRQNLLLFAFEGIFSFTDLFVERFDSLQAAALLSAILTIFFIFVTGLIWACQYLLDRYTNDKSKHSLGVKVKGRRSAFNSNIRARSLLSFWLQLLPWLFISGMLFIVVAIGQSAGQSRDLLNQLSGQAMGLAVMLLCAGLFFLYIVKVLEPAAEKRATLNGDKQSKWRINLELLIAIVVINLLLLILVFNDIVLSLSDNPSKLISIICFMGLANISAITIGYALRHKNLLRTRYHLERRTSDLTELLVSLSSTKPMKLWLNEEGQFNKRFLKLQEELFQLMESKTKNLRRLDSWSGKIDTNTENKKDNRNFLQRLKQVVINKVSPSISSGELVQFRRVNFPQLSYQIDSLERSLNGKKTEYDELNQLLKKIDEHNTDVDWDVKSKLSNLNAHKKVQSNNRMSLLQQRTQIRIKLTQESKIINGKLRQGFLLGEWLQNNILL